MPRKQLVYTDLFPYHVRARANNKEWFYLPQELVWKIFVEELTRLTKSHQILVHAFVLMNNHYHMLISTHVDFPLHEVMQSLQKAVSRKINRIAKRENHVFGGPYRGSLIDSEEYYANVLRYVAQNPIRAKIVDTVSSYRFSSFATDDIPVCSPRSGIAAMVPSENLTDWLNDVPVASQSLMIRKGLLKTLFKPVSPR